MQEPFIFDPNQTTHEELMRRRLRAQQLLEGAQGGIASNVGQGMAQLGQSLAGRIGLSMADGKLRKRRAAALSGAQGLFGTGAAPSPGAAMEAALDEAPPSAGNIEVRLARDLMAGLNLSPAAAAGIVGNLWHETGGFKHMQEIKPVVPGSRGGFGFAQWTGPRRRSFEAWAKANNLNPSSYEANLGFLKHELTATPEGRVMPALKAANTPDEAARVFSTQFLRPGIPHMNSRVSRARNIAAMIGNGSPQIVPASEAAGGAQPPAPMGMSFNGMQPQQPAPAMAAPSQQQAPVQPVPASAPPPGAMAMTTTQARPSAYQAMMRNSIDRGRAPEAVQRQFARPPMAGAPNPVMTASAPFAGQGGPSMQAGAPAAAPSGRLQQLQGFILSGQMEYLSEPQQKFIMDEYQRELARANPEPVKGTAVGGRLVNPVTGEVIYEPPPEAAKPGYRVLTADEKRRMGLPEHIPMQVGPDNKVEPIKELMPGEAQKPPSSVQEYQFYTEQERAAGREPKSYEEWSIGGKKAGATSVDARQMGNIPPGYQVEYDEQGRPARMVPIPGSPAAMDAEAAATANATRRGAEVSRADIVTQDIDRVLKTMETGILPDTGFGAMLSNVPGTDARAIAALLDTVKANIGFQELNKMRQQSPTGGALGNVTERELAFLQSVAGSLDQSQDAGQLRDNLNRLWNSYQDVIHGPGNGPQRRPLSFQQEFGPPPPQGPQPGFNLGPPFVETPSPAPSWATEGGPQPSAPPPRVNEGGKTPDSMDLLLLRDAIENDGDGGAAFMRGFDEEFGAGAAIRALKGNR